MNCQVWQISGGPGSRSYADVFLRHGVGLIGPGDSGAWAPDRSDEDFGDGQGSAGGFVRRFATELKLDDVILLRTGLSRIRAVGLVASEYLYLNQFDDVNGWDLQHARRIRWCELPADYDFGSSVFGANSPRFSRAASDEVIDYARRFILSPPTHWQQAPLPALPPEEPLLDEIPEALQGVISEVQDLHTLMWDRERFGDHPTEDELVAHFVVPLVRALGWPPERIAVKWHYIDVTLFRAQSQASGRSQVSSGLFSSFEVNLVEVSSMLWIRSRPEVYADSSGVVASPARIGIQAPMNSPVGPTGQRTRSRSPEAV